MVKNRPTPKATIRTASAASDTAVITLVLTVQTGRAEGSELGHDRLPLSQLWRNSA
jgi:hypothetical protein